MGRHIYIRLDNCDSKSPTQLFDWYVLIGSQAPLNQWIWLGPAVPRSLDVGRMPFCEIKLSLAVQGCWYVRGSAYILRIGEHRS